MKSPSLLPLPVEAHWSNTAVPIGRGVRRQIPENWNERAEATLTWFEGRLAQVLNCPGLPQGELPLEICLNGECGMPSLHDDESVALRIEPAGVCLTVASQGGLVRGLALVLRLVTPMSGGYAFHGCVIRDAPRFRWRGLMLDPARHFLPMPALRRTLDGMADVGLNVLHLHLSDDQGFRFPSSRYPLLGDGCPDPRRYQRADLIDLVKYAAVRGIRLVPEIDMPGHVTSWLGGYPELAGLNAPPPQTAAFGIRRWALAPERPATQAFIGNLLDEVIAVFPDEYLHIGGDEVHPQAWPDAQGEQGEQRQGAFNRWLREALKQRNRRMVAWDEVLSGDLPEEVCVQAWRGPAGMAACAGRAGSWLASSGWYLDLGFDAATHYGFDPAADSGTLQNWQADLAKGWRMAALQRPLAGFGRFTETALGELAQRPPSGAADLLGGEACLWGELVSGELLDGRLWDRLPAVAEVLWSGPRASHDLAARSLALQPFWRLTGGPDPAAVVDRALARWGLDGPQRRGVRDLITALAPLPWYGRHLGTATLAARALGDPDPDDAARPYAADTTLDRLVDFVPVDCLRTAMDIAHCEQCGGGWHREWQAFATELAERWRSQGGAVQSAAIDCAALAEVLPLAERCQRLGEFLALAAAPDGGFDEAAWQEFRTLAEPPVAELQLVGLDIVERIRSLRK